MVGCGYAHRDDSGRAHGLIRPQTRLSPLSSRSLSGELHSLTETRNIAQETGPHSGPFSPHVCPAETENRQAPVVTDGIVGPLARLGKSRNMEEWMVVEPVSLYWSLFCFSLHSGEINRERPNLHRRFSAKRYELSNLISTLWLLFRAE